MFFLLQACCSLYSFGRKNRFSLRYMMQTAIFLQIINCFEAIWWNYSGKTGG
jgi:hypothetical protein